MSPILRPYRESDVESLRAIFNHVVAAGEAFVYETPLDADEFRRYLAGFTAAWVAESDGRVVGGYVLRPNLPGRGAHVANAAYFVDPQARGLGIGRRLGEHSLDAAREMGFLAMQFNAVVAGNDAAVNLWRRLGFQVIGTVPGGFRMPDGSFSDLLIMHRRL